jgi:hypothetical protein
MEGTANLIPATREVESEYISDLGIQFLSRFHFAVSFIQQGAPPLRVIKRFAGFPALNIGNLHIVLFQKWKVGFYRRTGETGKGLCKLTAMNLGPLLFMRDCPITQPNFGDSPINLRSR